MKLLNRLTGKNQILKRMKKSRG